MPKSYQTLNPFVYKVNRPLGEDEIRDHLPQKEPSRSAPWNQLTVIRMNSTFLECMDKMHGGRGTMAGFAIVSAPLVFGLIKAPFWFLSTTLNAPAEKFNEGLFFTLASFFILSLLLALYIFVLRLEFFRYTHYPTRFNRKTRMVHVFRHNGKVLSVPWDKVYFTLAYCVAGYWEVVGHILSEDGKTVLDTFSLSTRSLRDDWNPKTTLYQQWEFVRRYMENGPQELYRDIPVVFPIDKKRESFTLGTKRFFANFAHWPLAMIIFSPALLLGSIGRWIALRTCKIPRWPDEVEAESQIEPGDPYIREEKP